MHTQPIIANCIPSQGKPYVELFEGTGRACHPQ